MNKRPARTLKARAIGYLARRDYSRKELGAKLLRDARLHAKSSGEPIAEGVGNEVEAALDAMEALGYLAEARVVESMVNRKSALHGTARIKQALRNLGVSEEGSAASLTELKATEPARAAAAWQRKFGEPATDLKARAKQMRFLAARGFAESAIRQVVPKVGGRVITDDDT